MNGYSYLPFTDGGERGEFVIMGELKDNTVLFIFKKSPENGKLNKPVCSDSKEVICRANVSSKPDWIRAEMEMVCKFNATIGRLEGIVIGM
jgi:hypothetical protein